MGNSGCILLTGATGFLGRYLLRGLLASGRRVAVLVRDGSAEERVRELTDSWADTRHDRPANPVVLPGDLCAPGLGLAAADRAWLARDCAAVLHAAADVSPRRSPTADPWATSVEGTYRGCRRRPSTAPCWRASSASAWPTTFEAVVRGRQSPQDAFLARRIEITGDVEKGLNLAVLFEHFVKQCPYPEVATAEDTDAVAVRA
ncbi:MAG TPA: SDR family oxidoreductase [Gemmataceae bacterium]|nr:SDR family oxidoreductase [Gemmataceae bacterium]